MLKRMSIRLRLTVLSVLLLTICCLGLTLTLNLSANRMADVIEAVPVTPSIHIGQNAVTEVVENAMVPLTPSENSQAARYQFFYKSIFYMIIIILTGGGLTYYISGKALVPLIELSKQMNNRTVHNLSEDLPLPKSHDEISDLTRSFNEMSSKLDEAFAMQKRFSQSAAHELRTPLTVLKTKVDVFKKKKDHTSDEYESLLYVITTHTNRLADLVNNLLNLTNMDELQCNEKVELKAMLKDIAEEISFVSKNQNINIVVSGTEQTVLGNFNLLHRAFYNLVENAVKYGREDGEVNILVGLNIGAVTITDNGIGIPSEMRELVFEPFFRVDKSRSRQIGGAGLGLPIVKSIINKHNGQIVILENPTGGCTIKIIL